MKNENRDALTGLANWNYVRGILPGIVGHNGQVALIMADIDRFKDYNEFFGHLPGDEKLIEIAREIEAACGENALVFRIGGDEFGVILYEASLEHAREVAERIRAQRREIQLTLWDKQEFRMLTLSLGIAHFPTHASNVENLIRAAELALLKAKQGGRNCVMAIGDFVDEPAQSAEFLK